MTLLRCIALDGDKQALAELTYLLQTDARIGFIAPLDSVEAAVDMIKHENIDAVFICLGSHTVEQVHKLQSLTNLAPAVIAMDSKTDTALDAFAVEAVDFIVKPSTRATVERAITRLIDRITRTVTQPSSASRISAERDGSTHFLDYRDILHISACGDYTTITTAAGEYSCRQSLSTLEAALSAVGFARIHRGWLVPLNRVERLSQDCGKTSVRIAGQEIPVSRRSTSAVKAQLRN